MKDVFCLDLSIECFEKSRRGRPLKPLQALNDFRVIYDGSARCSSDGRAEKSPTRFGGQQAAHDRPKLQASSTRRSRSLSPVKDTSASRDATRGKTTTSTAVAKSTSVYTSLSCAPGREKRPLHGSAGVRTDAAKHGPETTSAIRIRQGRRTKESGTSTSTESKDNGSPAETESTRGRTAPTSAKSTRQQGTVKEPKKKVAGVASTEDNPDLPNRGS